MTICVRAGAFLFVLAFLAYHTTLPRQLLASGSGIVVSQVYGGGGNSGATYTHDFIELFNAGPVPVSLAGWSLQYASATGSGNFGANSGQLTELPSLSLAPGQYLLVQEAQGAGGTTPLPAPDVVDATPIAMAATGGKVALVNNTTPLGCNGGSSPCSPAALATIVDLVGYGSANFFEGSGPTPAPSNTTAVLRAAAGCTDADVNAADFAVAAPAPRNSAAPFGVCANAPVLASCGAPVSTQAGVPFSTSVSATDADGVVILLSLASITPAPQTGGVAVSDLVPAGSAGGTATATLAGALEPAGSYEIAVTAANSDVPTPQTGTCSLSVTVTPPPRSIHEIQGTGASSPFAGTLQATTGIVTVILSNGFFLQDPVGDADPASSNGIFVFTGASLARSVAPGDELSVTGTVVEFRPSSRPRDLTLTELSSPVTLVKTGTGAALPAPVLIADRPDSLLSPDGIDAFEALEGMLVEIETPKVVGPTNDFGELLVVASGDASHTTASGDLLVEPLGGDDVDYNPERIMLDDEARVPGGSGSGTRINAPQVQASVGSLASGNVVGALDYQFSNYRVQASHQLSDVISGSLPASPIGDLRPAQPFEGRIATYNVLNLFDCVDAPGKSDRASCSPADLAALETQLAKLAAGFEQELGSPEIVIVEEAENTQVLSGDAGGYVPGTSVPALLPRLSGNFAASSFDASDERGIEVAFVYDTSRVTLNAAYLSTDILPDTGGVFDGTVFRAGREPLVGHFSLDDIEVIVVGNHLKSKGGSQLNPPSVPEQDAGDDPLYGSFQPPARWTEQVRHLQADHLRSLVDLLLAQHPGASVVVGGDMNDFSFPEPGEGQDTLARIKDSTSDPLLDVADLVAADSRYTFVFEGNAQVLDHMLVNSVLASRLRDQGIGHFNANYPTALASDPAVTLRASDHDPLVAYFCTDATPPVLSASASPGVLWPPNHRYVTVNASVSVSDGADPGPSVSLISVTSSEPDDGLGDGDQPNDIVIIDQDTFQLRAERSGGGSGRVYTITYSATDACGNTTLASATVTVPHDLSGS